MRLRRSKYGAEPTTVDGIRFASKKEARRYAELKLLERADHIYQLSCQPRYELTVTVNTVAAKLAMAAQRLRDRTKALSSLPSKRIGFYVGDFRYRERATDQQIVEDVKGYDTPLSRWKRRHVEAQYGIKVVII